MDIPEKYNTYLISPIAEENFNYRDYAYLVERVRDGKIEIIL